MLLGTIRRFSEVFVVSGFFSTPTPPPFSPTSHPGLTVFLSKMSSFLIKNRFSATLSPRCNPRAADLRILLRITLKYLKIVSKICNSPKNIEVGFSRERPPARPHNGPNGPGPNRSVGRAASNSIRMYRSSAAARFHSHEARRTVWGGETGRDRRSRDPPPRGLGPLGPLWGRSLENPTSIIFF